MLVSGVQHSVLTFIYLTMRSPHYLSPCKSITVLLTLRPYVTGLSLAFQSLLGCLSLAICSPEAVTGLLVWKQCALLDPRLGMGKGSTQNPL